VSSSLLREQLAATLEETLRVQQQLVANARDPQVTLPELFAQVDVVERLDDYRDELLAGLRREARARARVDRRSPPVREIVLGVLADFGCPQNARFLEEYLWVSRHTQLDSRALAPLRRDEQRAWVRSPRAREAYIAPALHEDGTANARWITSSAWDVQRRIVSPGLTERLLDLHKILILADGPGAGGERPRRPSDTMLERYAEQVLDAEPLPPSATTGEAVRWRLRMRRMAERESRRLAADDERRRKERAAHLTGMPERERIWGRVPG
jgi:hypothetical protein